MLTSLLVLDHVQEVRHLPTRRVLLTGTLARCIVPEESTWWCPDPAPAAHQPVTHGTPSTAGHGDGALSTSAPAAVEGEGSCACVIVLTKMNLELHAG